MPVNPRAASRARSGASNSRSLTVSRKPATTSRNKVCLPLAVDDLDEPPLLLRWHRVHLDLDAVSIGRGHDHRESRLAVLAERDVHLLQNGEKALGGVAVRVNGVAGRVAHLADRGEVRPHRLIELLVGDAGDRDVQILEVPLDQRVDRYRALSADAEWLDSEL